MRPSLLISLVLFLALPAAAQDAVLIGKVSDSVTSKPLGGVIVHATSPALQGEQVVWTDESGGYGFPGLPPGIYALSFERTGFQSFVRAGIRLRIGLIFRANVQLDAEELGGCRFAESYPTLDASSSSTGVRLGREHILNLPLPRP
jgi:hypothetical protein